MTSLGRSGLAAEKDPFGSLSRAISFEQESHAAPIRALATAQKKNRIELCARSLSVE